MKTSLKISLALMLISTAFFAGCSNMTDNNSGNTDAGNFLTISPADNTQNIGINDAVTIQFAAPVDTKTIEANFVLISQKDIADSLCPVSKNMGHSDMMKDMMDTTMMNHLKMTHHTKGTFKWNSNKTMCEFKSDSALSHNTDYMMYIHSDMMNHMKNMMNNSMSNGGMNMGGNMNMMNGQKASDLIFKVTRFRTMNK
ncbi:MAG: Ig-like domain-containing protein [Candidatus Kapabacteria bacterium]|nr:Ig-like domain-containing protein [Ignavibacteriota bacterium]MCW5884863.1 Ig-like domain-containing protein [Candidatus Kapabacteria bacterium]